MSTTDERNIDPIKELIRIGENILSLTLLGFKESYRSAKPGKIIYDSEWCRISLIWGGWDQSDGNSINIRYGRLHAPNEKLTFSCKGEDFRCWHRVEHPMHFLDGRTPADVAKLGYSHFLITPFYDKEILQKYSRRQPEWLAEMHLTIWQHYGQKLFELFDLRKPEYWQQYQRFLKEVYDIEGRNPAIRPSLDKVC
jgi:hypothetical protein